MAALATLLERIGLAFDDTTCITQALVHRSFMHEHASGVPASNERLEFLGDAVLSVIAAELVYQAYPAADEGQLTEMRAALIRTTMLADHARALGLGAFMRIGRGAERGGARDNDNVLADGFEALIGAIYQSHGLAGARTFLEPRLRQHMAVIGTVDDARADDFKSRLQRDVQRSLNQTPRYRTVGTSGPDHQRTFTIEVHLGEQVLGVGSGPSKQAASQDAARRALEQRSALEQPGG
jgi:ribonuclease-3